MMEVDKMVKLICDKCCEEVSNLYGVKEYTKAKDSFGNTLVQWYKHTHELCDKCHDRFERSNLDIADFMNCSIEELLLFDDAFKVGDEVITDDGRVGIIESICTCEKCKERGFYEPMVRDIVTGSYHIYISDTDKENGFRNFYKIGNHIYGNIDEDTLLYYINSTREEMLALTARRRALAKQAQVLEKCKKEQENNK